MKKSFSFIVVFLLLALVSGSAYAAACDPRITASDPRDLCVNMQCDEMGKTHMDRDNQNVIACVGLPYGEDYPNCAANPEKCIWTVLTGQKARAIPLETSFLTLTELSYNKLCKWRNDYTIGRKVDDDGPWQAYFACSNACYRFCLSRPEKFRSGFISEWDYTKRFPPPDNSGTAECSCVY